MEQPMRFIVSLLLVLFVLIPPAAKAQTEVDLALVLAVDMSGSMDPEEQTLQREGFVEAFRSTMIHNAIREGVHGRSRSFIWNGRTHCLAKSPYHGR
jgi:hypothetical protein